MKSHAIHDMAHMAPADQQNGGAAHPQFDADEMKRRAQYARDISASFGQVISLMMQSRQHRLTLLAELEWLVMPALTTRQFRVAEGVNQERGIVAPIAAVLWAHVSPEIDKRISGNLDQPIKLKPEEWRSGEHTWIIETLGENNAVTALLQHLKQNELKDKTVRMRVRGQDGKPAIGRVELQAEGT